MGYTTQIAAEMIQAYRESVRVFITRMCHR
jgi:hypothetical protein